MFPVTSAPLIRYCGKERRLQTVELPPYAG
jgi:hypothetical protein